jgi:hypothetical protein
MNAMKTIPALTFLAALVAFVLFPHNLALAGSLLFAACLGSIFIADCARTIKPLAVPASVVVFPRPSRRAPAFGLAA